MKKIHSIIFMGTPDFALPCLNALIQKGYDLRAVITQPDRPKGRHNIVEFSEIKKAAVQHGIPVLQPERIRKDGWPERIAKIGCDLAVTCAFGQILPKEILDIPVHGTINVHASLLPKYRGASPIQKAIMDGCDITGVTTMLTDIGMDTGDILLKKETDIFEDEDAGTLHDRLSLMGASLLIDTIELYKQGKITGMKQDESHASYAPMIKKRDGLMDFDKNALQLHNLVRAFSPWPGTYTYYLGKKMKVLKTRYSDACHMEDVENGMVLAIDKQKMSVKCEQGVLHIVELQFEDRKAMRICDCGHNMTCNIVLGRF